MDFDYGFAGPSFSKGRLFRIIQTERDNAYPIKRLDVHIPSIVFLEKKINSFGELDVKSRITMNTGYGLVYTPDIGYTYFGLRILGFGFSITIQLSY